MSNVSYKSESAGALPRGCSEFFEVFWCCQEISHNRSGSVVAASGGATLRGQVRSALAVGTAALLESQQPSVTPSVDAHQTYVAASEVVNSMLTEIVSAYRASQSDVIMSRCE